MVRVVTIPTAFSAGLVSGLFIGIWIKTGQDISQEGIAFTILNAFCGTTQTKGVSVCSNLWLIEGISLIAGVIVLIADIVSSLFFAAGFFLGLLLPLMSH